MRLWIYCLWIDCLGGAVKRGFIQFLSSSYRGVGNHTQRIREPVRYGGGRIRTAQRQSSVIGVVVLLCFRRADCGRRRTCRASTPSHSGPEIPTAVGYDRIEPPERRVAGSDCAAAISSPHGDARLIGTVAIGRESRTHRTRR